jgi:hypothetical protein
MVVVKGGGGVGEAHLHVIGEQLLAVGDRERDLVLDLGALGLGA